MTVALIVVGIYALTPFVAGLLNTYDQRGPKIFNETHHEILYTIGYHMDHDGTPRSPHRQERSWFYGIPGQRMPELRIREQLEAQER
jgi:hypothetical protein